MSCRPAVSAAGVGVAAAALLLSGALSSGVSSASTAAHHSPKVLPRVHAAHGVHLNSFEFHLLADMNRVRRSHHLPTLKAVPGATDVARHWTWHLARVQQLSHNPQLVTKLEHHGSARWTEIEENVGYGPITSPEALFQAYMHSPPHRYNILSNQVSEVGIGVVQRGPYAWNTVDFVNQYSPSYGPSRVPADGLLAHAVTPRATTLLASGARSDDRFGVARTEGISASTVRFASGATQAQFGAHRRTGHGELVFREALSLRHVTALRFRLGALSPGHRAVRVAIAIGDGWKMRTLKTVRATHPRSFTIALPKAARGLLNTIEFQVSGRSLDSAAHRVTLSVANLTAVAG